MSHSTAELPTADSTTVDHAAEPQSNLWTSDSEREASRTAAAAAEGARDDGHDIDMGAVGATGTTDDDSPPAADVSAVPDATARPGKPRNDPRARVEAATRKEAIAKEEAKLAREEAGRLRAELDRLRQPAPAAQDPPVPDADRFWQDPLTVARQLAAEEAQRVYQEQQQRQAYVQAHQTYAQRATAFEAQHPDFQEVVAQAPHVPGIILQAVLQSDLGPQIAYDLGSHPEVAAQLAQEFARLPADAVPLVRRVLEARLTATAAARPDSASPVRPSAAKPPISRVGGTASITPADPEDLEFGPEYIRRENAREKKAREAGRW